MSYYPWKSSTLIIDWSSIAYSIVLKPTIVGMPFSSVYLPPLLFNYFCSFCDCLFAAVIAVLVGDKGWLAFISCYDEF